MEDAGYHCECGTRLTLYDLVIVPTDSAVERMRVSPSSFRWYHATQVPDWHNTVVMAGASVHVGEHTTSRDIALAAWYHEKEPQPFWMYEVEIDPEAPVSPRVYRDMNDDMIFPPDAVCRYVNRWESPGSLSLYLPAKFVKVVEVHKFFPEDVVGESLYTIDLGLVS